MYIVFFSTSDVFKAEELLKKSDIKCEIVPTPATDRAYCGVCVKIENNASLEVISSLEYSTMED